MCLTVLTKITCCLDSPAVVEDVGLKSRLYLI